MKNASFSVDDVVYSFFSLDRIQHFCPQLCLFALQPHTKKDKKSLLFRSWSSTKAQNMAQKEFLMLEKFHIFRDIKSRGGISQKFPVTSRAKPEHHRASPS